MDETRRYRVSGDAPFTLFHKLHLPGEVLSLTEKEAQRWEQARPGSLEALDKTSCRQVANQEEVELEKKELCLLQRATDQGGR